LYISTAKDVNVLDTEREWISGWKYLKNIKCVLYSALNTMINKDKFIKHFKQQLYSVEIT
jgi:hypothetical protein